MATMDAFLDYQDACDELTEACSRVKKDKEIFQKLADNFQKWVAIWEPNYWKIDEDSIKTMTGNIKDMTLNVEKVIACQEKSQ